MMQGGKDMSKEEMLLESIRNYFRLETSLIRVDIFFPDGKIIECK